MTFFTSHTIRAKERYPSKVKTVRFNSGVATRSNTVDAFTNTLFAKILHASISIYAGNISRCSKLHLLIHFSYAKLFAFKGVLKMNPSIYFSFITAIILLGASTFGSPVNADAYPQLPIIGETFYYVTNSNEIPLVKLIDTQETGGNSDTVYFNFIVQYLDGPNSGRYMTLKVYYTTYDGVTFYRIERDFALASTSDCYDMKFFDFSQRFCTGDDVVATTFFQGGSSIHKLGGLFYDSSIRAEVAVVEVGGGIRAKQRVDLLTLPAGCMYFSPDTSLNSCIGDNVFVLSYDGYGIGRIFSGTLAGVRTFLDNKGSLADELVTVRIDETKGVTASTQLTSISHSTAAATRGCVDGVCVGDTYSLGGKTQTVVALFRSGHRIERDSVGSLHLRTPIR